MSSIFFFFCDKASRQTNNGKGAEVFAVTHRSDQAFKLSTRTAPEIASPGEHKMSRLILKSIQITFISSFQTATSEIHRNYVSRDTMRWLSKQVQTILPI